MYTHSAAPRHRVGQTPDTGRQEIRRCFCTVKPPPAASLVRGIVHRHRKERTPTGHAQAHPQGPQLASRGAGSRKYYHQHQPRHQPPHQPPHGARAGVGANDKFHQIKHYSTKICTLCDPNGFFLLARPKRRGPQHITHPFHAHGPLPRGTANRQPPVDPLGCP